MTEDFMKNRKKLVIACLCALTASAVFFTGCSGSDASNAARISTSTAHQVDAVVKKLDTVSDKSFKFPTAFGNNFFTDGDQNKNQDAFFTGSYTPGPEYRRRINGNRTGRYVAEHFTLEELNQDNKNRTAYLDKFDDLYVLCADISAINTKIKNRTEEIIRKNAENKIMAQNLKKTKASAETFSNISRKNEEINYELQKLNKDRNKLARQTRLLPDSGDNINVDALTVKYSSIMEKLNKRLESLEALDKSISDINNSMKNTTAATQNQQYNATQNQPYSATQDPQYYSTQNRQQNNMGYPITSPQNGGTDNFYRPVNPIHNLTEAEKQQIRQFQEQREKIMRQFREQHSQRPEQRITA
jgi:hypothetical protein